MKRILLILSLVLNAAVVGAMWLRSGSSHLPIREETVVVNPAHRVTVIPPGARFDTDDARTLRDRLREAGFPADLVRAIVVAHVRQQARDQNPGRDFAGASHDYWSGSKMQTREALRANLKIGAETSDLLRELLGPDYDQSARRRAESVRQYGSIAPDKVESLERLEKDYRDLMNSYSSGFFKLPSDREALLFIEAERRADLSTLLTPREHFEYEVRKSNAARRLTSSLKNFGASEDEFRQLYSLWEPTADEQQLGGLVVINRNASESSNQKLLADSATVLSPGRLADLEQALRPGADFENAVVTRVGLPLSAARQLSEARTEVSAKIAAAKAAQARGEEVSATAVRLDPERGQQLWNELVETFGEETLQNLRPQSGGNWLNSIAPTPPETGG